MFIVSFRNLDVALLYRVKRQHFHESSNFRD